MTRETTGYDQVLYPAEVYAVSDPSRLAALARLHGLTAPDPATARVLEIAGGDGINMVAMAAAWPRAQFVSFDLASSAVERGRALALAAGLDNVEIVVGDVLDWAAQATGQFDYVIAHGLYAWVPAPVRDATLRLIDRVLADTGVAFISYNALPGGYLRQAVRAMVLHHVRDEADPDRRVAQARARLGEFVVSRPGDSAALAGLRQVAKPMLAKPAGVLFHDELADAYAPQLLTEVVAAAAAHGLAFLNDATPSMIRDGLPGLDVAESAVVDIAQADDFAVLAFFHQTLFVRPGRTPARGVVAGNFCGMLATTTLRPAGPGRFSAGEATVEIGDPRLCEILTLMGRLAPWRLPLDSLADSPEHCDALIELVRRDVVVLHAAQLPAVQHAGERPQASALVRAQLALGSTRVFAIDLTTIALGEPAVRHFVGLLDGTRDHAALARDWAASPWGTVIDAATAVDQVARGGMLLA
ncbi:class I SAM-dependent methyltransferase [Novosphingobium sp.]|uniref:class I SAM-dependent methyltransferase n=1 Tax=Novosphingobium sp. TaxID=1874826 RepID=UPI00333FF645